MAQSHGENLKQAMDTLRAHKMRSALTVFGGPYSEFVARRDAEQSAAHQAERAAAQSE